ncbi:MAG: sigma-70 family RNA polymerase sigma factor [Bacilli bacterium]|nr:sigma-70 family RNA polymerase sigma factor [Bacilli bacterium]
MSSRFKHENIELENIIGSGSVGLVKAIKTFDVSKGYKFSSYAGRCIENEILMSFRSYKKSANMDVSLDEDILKTSEGGTVKLFDVIPDNGPLADSAYDYKETCNELEEAIEQLDEIEKEVINGTYGLNGSTLLMQKELAAKLGMTQPTISRILRRACLKMKKYISLKYIDNVGSKNKIKRPEKIKIEIPKKH